MKNSISVLIATYNKDKILEETLNNFLKLDLKGLDVEFIVIDNNSTDNTKKVIKSFQDILPITYLFESRSGKNKALNKALREVKLKDLVVFTDDDITPAKDWLQKIVEVSDKNKKYSVFGGEVYPVWPDCKIPSWAKDKSIWPWAFTYHTYPEGEYSLDNSKHPSGPNFWVRKKVFEDGNYYDESIGPDNTEKYAMGSEASFLISLKKRGYKILHSKKVIVGHRIRKDQFSFVYIKKRAKRWGKGIPHLSGISHKDLFNKNIFFWYILRLFSFIKWILYYISSFVLFDKNLRINSIIWLYYNLESFRISSKLK